MDYIISEPLILIKILVRCGFAANERRLDQNTKIFFDMVEKQNNIIGRHSSCIPKFVEQTLAVIFKAGSVQVGIANLYEKRKRLRPQVLQAAGSRLGAIQET